MSPSTALLDLYRERAHRRLIAFTAVIMFFDGLAVVYRFHLREVLDQMVRLSAPNEIAYLVGPMVFEPVLLFGALYYTATTMDRKIPLLLLMPGLAAAVLVGGIAGQLVGMDTWHAVTPLGFVQGSNVLAIHPTTFLLWQDVLAPLVRALLTAIAALGLAQA